MSTDVLTKRLELRGASRELFSRREDEVLICGAAGTGKSFGALWKIHMMCLKNGACVRGCKIEHEHHDRGMRALIVRKTHNSLTSTGLVTFKQHVAVEALSMGLLKWYGGSGADPAQFIYGNGSQIIVGGMDNATKIMSSEYDVIFVQEATELSITDWEKLTSRLRNGRISFSRSSQTATQKVRITGSSSDVTKVRQSCCIRCIRTIRSCSMQPAKQPSAASHI